MGYYHITLCPISWKLYIIVLPWGKFKYQKLPMRLCDSPDIFQEKMNELFNGLENGKAYIDDLFIISNDNFETESTCFQNQCRKILFCIYNAKVFGFFIN